MRGLFRRATLGLELVERRAGFGGPKELTLGLVELPCVEDRASGDRGELGLHLVQRVLGGRRELGLELVKRPDGCNGWGLFEKGVR